MTTEDHKRKYRTIHDCKKIRDHTGQYKYTHAYRPTKECTGHQQTILYKTIQDHTRPYIPIQDHTEPYQTIEGHIRGNKCAQSQKELCIYHSLTDSGYFTHIELPTQLKKKV